MQPGCWGLLAAAVGSWRRLAASSSWPAGRSTHHCHPSHHPSSVQEYVKFDAIIVSGNTVYVGDMDTVLGEDSVHSMSLKAIKLR